MTDAASTDAIAPVAFVSERCVLEVAASIPGRRLLATTLGRAQAARGLASARPEASVDCWMLDEYRRRLAVADAATDERQGRLSILCQADPPDDVYDLAVTPFSKSGEAELARDVLQAAFQRLAIGGALVAAVDNPRDQWLRRQLDELAQKVTVEQRPDATVYVVVKTAEPRRLRDFRCEFPFRDSGRLLTAVTRPGVFSHRRVDPGARRLLAAAEVKPGERILDIGCGSGVVGLALAARTPGGHVHAVDSHARAIQCTAEGARLSGLENVTVELNATGEYDDPGTFDLALANPPYYADFRIAELFLSAAARSIRPGGRLLAVAKRPEHYPDALVALWREVEIVEAKGYFVISATRR